MAQVKYDRLQETTSSTGTGALTLAGAVSKFRAFSSVLSDGDTCVCLIEHNNSTEWEVSLCTYASGGNALTRSTIYASSTGSIVSFSAGTKTISQVLHAAGTHIGFTSLTALAGPGTAVDDLFVVWDASTSLPKTITRDEMASMFKGTGNSGSNVVLGAGSFALNSSGGNCTAIGNGALAASTSGTLNTAIGSNTLATLTTGANNVAIGRSAGSALTIGTNCIIIGLNAAASAVDATNEITLGNSSIATIRAQVTSITALSDERDKKNIRPLDLGLDFLLSIEPKWFEWNMRPETDSDGNTMVGKVDITEAGFIAQQLQAAVVAHPGSEAVGLVFDANPDRIEATPGKLIPVLVKAIHDLNARLVAAGL